jgi:hypothetical protein
MGISSSEGVWDIILASFSVRSGHEIPAVFPRKQQRGVTTYLGKMALKDPLAERVDIFQLRRVDKDSAHAALEALDGVEQFKCGTPVKRAPQLQVEAASVLMGENLKAVGHWFALLSPKDS